MSLKIKWMCRNFLLGTLYSLFSVTSFLFVLAWVKTEKLQKFAGFMYRGNLNDPQIWESVHLSYWKSDVLPVLYWLPIALVFDVLVRRYFKMAKA